MVEIGTDNNHTSDCEPNDTTSNFSYLGRLQDLACVKIMAITPTIVGAERGRSGKVPMGDEQGNWQVAFRYE